MKSKLAIYWKLFISTFTLSAFTFGGGYVIIPLMKKKFVEELKWIDENEMLDFVAIAQSSPGAVAVNASILVGRKVAGIKGSLIAILGTILPPLIILSVISLFYIAFKENRVIAAMLKGMQAGIAAVIANIVFSMGSKIVKEKDLLSILLMAAVFSAVFFLKINVALIILFCIVLGVLKYLFNKNKRVKS